MALINPLGAPKNYNRALSADDPAGACILCFHPRCARQIKKRKDRARTPLFRVFGSVFANLIKFLIF